MQSRPAATTAPPHAAEAVDLVHLSRQTFGDRALEREVLALFVTQSSTCIRRLERAATADARFEIAHTLKGSARSVGAWRVAEAAGALESAARTGEGDPAADCHALLTAEVAVANAYICTLLSDL